MTEDGLIEGVSRALRRPGTDRKMISCQSSEVWPSGPVAEAVTGAPAAIGVGRRTLNDAFPEPSVVTCVEPM